jgi:serine protease inhibitor
MEVNEEGSEAAAVTSVEIDVRVAVSGIHALSPSAVFLSHLIS